ncbi:nucleotidyl transferase AbiEii/AbiGii toxin family protein [Candidatus Uhrbacteria bacterium]|nr:nucleotidyl transferase AbiEii/AbiGii toxin family protein [Candidatus Uhrbacteria bacterium]
MTGEELNQFVRGLRISKDQILREEAEMLFLNELAQNRIGAQVLFYGGTALRLAYGSPRFSEDIDLLRTKPLRFLEFTRFARSVEKKYSKWKLADIKDKRKTFFALYVISDEKLKHNFSLKIELHKAETKARIDAHLILLKSAVSVAEPLLLVPSLVDLKRFKEDALKERKKARDVFDLWYISQSLRVPFSLPSDGAYYTRREFENELRVFLPREYYKVIDELYERTAKKD